MTVSEILRRGQSIHCRVGGGMDKASEFSMEGVSVVMITTQVSSGMIRLTIQWIRSSSNARDPYCWRMASRRWTLVR